MEYEVMYNKVKGKIDPERPLYNDDLAKQVLLLGLPDVTLEKQQKFMDLIVEITKKLGIPCDKEKIIFPFGENKICIGYMILVYSSFSESYKAAQNLDKTKLGKNILKALIMNDFKQYCDSLNTQPLAVDLQDAYSYLSDNLKEEYFIETANEGKLLKMANPFEFSSKPEELARFKKVIENPNEPEKSQKSDIKQYYWSSQGTFLFKVEKEKVQILAGKEMKLIREVIHPNVVYLNPDNNEKYLLTMDEHTYAIVWDIYTGEMKRRYDLEGNIANDDFFTWSYDGKYLMKKIQNKLSIYETPSMLMIADEKGNQNSILLPDIKSAKWSSKKNLVAYYQITDQNMCQIGIIDIPSKNKIFTKTLGSAQKCRIYWNSAGTDLAYVAERYIIDKKKLKEKKQHKKEGENIQIEEVKEEKVEKEEKGEKGEKAENKVKPEGQKASKVVEKKNVENVDYILEKTIVDIVQIVQKNVEVIEENFKEVIDFSWDNIKPKRFALLSIDIASKQDKQEQAALTLGKKVNFSVFAIEQEENSKIYKLKKINKKKFKIQNFNRVSWNPNGPFVLLAYTKPLDVGINDTTGRTHLFYVSKDDVISHSLSSYDNASAIMWDMTGRYILSCILENKERPNLNCGYKIYNLKGETLYTGLENKIKSIVWRPRFMKPKDKDSFSKDELAKIVEEVRVQDEKTRRKI